MKRFILTMAAFLIALGASAQQWGVGGRIGAGLQAQGEYTFSNNNYIEARFGMSWCEVGATLMADFTAIYQWDVLTMNWTPRAGQWFMDAGVGVGVGGRGNYAYVGPVGAVKLGIKLNRVPLKIAVDWTPMFGMSIAYGGGHSYTEFHEYGLANFGLSCVYCF